MDGVDVAQVKKFTYVKTHDGGLNLTTLPASFPTLQNAAVGKPNTDGINIVEYKAI